MEATAHSDKVLVRKMLPGEDGDHAACARAWETWYATVGAASVLAFVRVENNSAEPDADIVQEAMVTAYTEMQRGRYEMRAGIPLTAYVKGIARNKIREARRRMRRTVPLDDVPEHEAKRHEQPEGVVERHERREALLAGLEALPTQRKRVLAAYLQGQSTAEIAAALGISEALVRQHKHRGLRALQLKLARPAG